MDPWQIDALGPALAVAALTIVKVIELVALPQGKFPVAKRVRVTPPAVMSAVLGV